MVTIRPAADGPQVIQADTLGAAWLAVAGRILAKGVASRSAAITTFQPHTDSSYIPRVSLLDFWRDYLRRVLAGTS